MNRSGLKIVSMYVLISGMIACSKNESVKIPAIAAPPAKAAPEQNQNAEAVKVAQLLDEALKNGKLEGYWQAQSLKSADKSQTAKISAPTIKVSGNKITMASDKVTECLISGRAVACEDHSNLEIVELNENNLIIQMADKTQMSFVRAGEPVEPVAPKVTPVVAGDFGDRDIVKDGGPFIPLMRGSEYTIWTRNWRKTLDTINVNALLIRTDGTSGLRESTAQLAPAFLTAGDKMQTVHFVRRGQVLKDGSLLFAVVEGTNHGNLPYRATYLMKTDSHLNQDLKYGTKGVYMSSSNDSVYSYRYIKDLRENDDGGITATEWRCVREGLPNNGECNCFDFQLTKTGHRKANFGKNGYQSLGACGDSPQSSGGIPGVTITVR